MIAEGRTPCINLSCRRTARADEFPDEMICGKCFRALPGELRAKHRRYWREYRKWARKVLRTDDPLKAKRMKDIRDRWAFLIGRSWERIRLAVMKPEKPKGLDAFIEELGWQ